MKEICERGLDSDEELPINARETYLAQRLIWQEQSENFIAAQADFRRVVQDHHDYLAALS